MNGNATHLVPLPALSSTMDRAHAANSSVRRFDVERASRVAENPFRRRVTACRFREGR